MNSLGLSLQTTQFDVIEEDPVLHVENGVVRGHNDQLFLAGGAQDVMGFATGRRQVPEESIECFIGNITQRAAACAAIGSNYLHVIFPDKHTVLTRDFPVPTISLAELYLARAAGVSGSVLYPVSLLRTLPGASFIRVDTHMTDLAVAHVATEVAGRLVGSPQHACLADLVATITRRTESSGDLGSKLTPPESEWVQTFGVDWNAASFSNDLSGGNNGIVDIYLHPGAPHPGRLLVSGDSFGRGTAFALSYFFAQVVFLRTPFLHREMLEQIRPDHVVTENVERYLSYVSPDELAPSFLLYPHLNGLDYRPSKAFARAFSAVLSHCRRPHEAFLAEAAGLCA